MGNYLAVMFCFHFIVSYDFSITVAVLLKHKKLHILLRIHGRLRLLCLCEDRSYGIPRFPLFSIAYFSPCFPLSVRPSPLWALRVLGRWVTLARLPTFAPWHVPVFSELCGKFHMPVSGTCSVGCPGQAVFSETFNAYHLRFTLWVS